MNRQVIVYPSLLIIEQVMEQAVEQVMEEVMKQVMDIMLIT
jgi:hypothetical protein